MLYCYVTKTNVTSVYLSSWTESNGTVVLIDQDNPYNWGKCSLSMRRRLEQQRL